MFKPLRKAFSLFLWLFLLPVRLFGLGDDAYKLWSLKEWFFVVGAPTAGSGFIGYVTEAYGVSPFFVALMAVGAFFLLMGLVAVGVENWKRHSTIRNRESSDDQAASISGPTSRGIVFRGGKGIRTRRNLTAGYDVGMEAEDVEDFESEDDVHLKDWPPHYDEKRAGSRTHDDKEDNSNRSEK